MKHMNKIIALLLAAVFLFAFSACGKKTPQEATISFSSNPTTGYTWYAFQSSDLFEISDEYVADEAAEGMTGVGGTHYFTLTPVKAGSCEVSFVYQRPWEAMELGDTYSYQVTVSNDMQITVTGGTAGVSGTEDEVPIIQPLTVTDQK